MVRAKLGRGSVTVSISVKTSREAGPRFRT